MVRNDVSRATLGRLPLYLRYLKAEVKTPTISATIISNALGLGEVQVRKDLNRICDDGRPKVGYHVDRLITDIESALGVNGITKAVIIGAGKLGRALFGYEGFKEYGLDICAAFDREVSETENFSSKKVYPMDKFTHYCKSHDIKIGILCVDAKEAQSVADLMVKSGITAIWNFAPYRVSVPADVTVRREDLALSLAHLKLSAQL